jgi:RNA polymerase sigma-70 factor (ECF subfamily)
MAADRDARFESLVRAYSSDLYRYAHWLCRDRWQAEDLVQETFGRAWRALDQLEDAGMARPWLLAILRNEHARLYERKRLDIEERELDELTLRHDSPLQAGLEVRQALARLPLGLREPLLLQALWGMDCAQIGATLGLSAGAVMTRLSRARQALRQLLDPAGDAKQAQRR